MLQFPANTIRRVNCLHRLRDSLSGSFSALLPTVSISVRRRRVSRLLQPTTDSARKAMLEVMVHGIVSVSVIAASTVLAALHTIDSAAWAAAVAAGIAASGAVSVLQGKATNGHITDEALAQLQRVGGRRRTDPTTEELSEHQEHQDYNQEHGQEHHKEHPEH